MSDTRLPPLPSNAPERLAALRAQDGRQRRLTPTLRAVLGGEGILPGREGEAKAIWESLLARAAGGDVAASEDMTLLTMLMAQHRAWSDRPEVVTELCERALAAAILPRHKHEQLGRLCRRAVVARDRGRAVELLARMDPAAPDLESDSEYRVATAVLAARDRDGRRMLAALGVAKDAVPIDDACDALASVLRAHGHELSGDLDAAVRALGELPDPSFVEQARASLPTLDLCPRSGATYTEAAQRRGARRVASSAGLIGRFLGGILGFIGLAFGVAGYFVTTIDSPDAASIGRVFLIVGGILFALGLLAYVRGRMAGRRAYWLWDHGTRLSATVMAAEPTNMLVNEVRVYELAIDIQAPAGSYRVTLRKPVLEHQVSALVGAVIHVRVHPTKPEEFLVE